jgi:hypothetical protein
MGRAIGLGMSWSRSRVWWAGGLSVWVATSCSDRESQTFAEAGRPGPGEAGHAQPAEGERPGHVASASPDPASREPRAETASSAGRTALQATETSTSPPDCTLIDRIVSAPSVQTGDAGASAIQVLLVPGVTPSSISWVFSPSSSARGTLSKSSAESSAQVSFDCETNGSAEIIVTVQAIRTGYTCSASARTVIECSNQPAAAGSGLCTDASCLRPTLGMCGKCALDYCAAQLVPVNDNLAAVEPILSCVLGKDWPAGERAATASCGNLDLLGCYCGGASPRECSTTAPEALDGACREQVLAGTGCRDSACLQDSLLDAGNATGKAMQYVRCTQDFCYDYCFNP